MAENIRSSIVTQGVQRSPNRAMLRAVGFTDSDFSKPIIGVANAYSTITPCNLGLDSLTKRAEAAVKQAGAMPQVFGTITVSDGISMGTEGMKYSLVSREVIADSIETACSAESMDGVVVVGAVRKQPRPRQIMTRKAFENATAVVMAVGGSTNAILHLLAIAHAAEVPLTIDDFETIRQRIPVLCDLKPSGRYVATDL